MTTCFWPSCSAFSFVALKNSFHTQFYWRSKAVRHIKVQIDEIALRKLMVSESLLNLYSLICPPGRNHENTPHFYWPKSVIWQSESFSLNSDRKKETVHLKLEMFSADSITFLVWGIGFPDKPNHSPPHTRFSCRVTVPPNLRENVYTFGFRQGSSWREWDFMWQKYRDATTAQEQAYILHALAQTDDLYLIQRFIVLLIISTCVRWWCPKLATSGGDTILPIILSHALHWLQNLRWLQIVFRWLTFSPGLTHFYHRTFTIQGFVISLFLHCFSFTFLLGICCCFCFAQEQNGEKTKWKSKSGRNNKIRLVGSLLNLYLLKKEESKTCLFCSCQK